MLRLKLRSFFRPVVSSPADSTLSVPSGYALPQSASSLLSEARRQQWLQMLWDYSSLPKDLYQQYYLQPLERCVTLMQQFPATENEHHAYLGGMVDHLLETVAYAARLSKNYLLPVGAQPEEQASQSAAWNAVIVYAVMLQALDGLCQIEVELESGQRWMPLNAIPGEPYRFRFAPVTDVLQVQSLGAMLAWKIIPDKALQWLSAWPEVLRTLSLYLTGFRNESGIVNAIVLEAIRTSIGKTAAAVADPAIATILPAVLEATLPLTASAANPAPILSIPSAEGNAPVALATSLDSAVSQNVLNVDRAKPVVEDVTGDLLTVMGFSESTSLLENQGETLTQATAVASRAEPLHPSLASVGEVFYQWLKKCLLEQSIAVNEAKSPVHIIAGYVFMRSPTIFYQFIAERKSTLAEQSHDWRVIQKQFEKLKLHKRQTDGTNVYCCQENKSGKLFNGYLIPAAKIYGAAPIPADSILTIIP
ncbi:TraI domain-containing protein [Serratia sp. DD3]|uniref:TraI domain-containing protein n=1 Tax=Serratia sp. DD3 TaxID=1410619 RepID=UPI0003C50692|nr:TraI domain-containing protein [Serratia sp. DD3]KEY60684.1 integrating conjugative element relaxase, PFGI-1 class [Serratia sp. DD3]